MEAPYRVASSSSRMSSASSSARHGGRTDVLELSYSVSVSLSEKVLDLVRCGGPAVA